MKNKNRNKRVNYISPNICVFSLKEDIICTSGFIDAVVWDDGREVPGNDPFN